jgi:hypothetical protein
MVVDPILIEQTSSEEMAAVFGVLLLKTLMAGERLVVYPYGKVWIKKCREMLSLGISTLKHPRNSFKQ